MGTAVWPMTVYKPNGNELRIAFYLAQFATLSLQLSIAESSDVSTKCPAGLSSTISLKSVLAVSRGEAPKILMVQRHSLDLHYNSCSTV